MCPLLISCLLLRLDDDRGLFVRVHSELFPILIEIGVKGMKQWRNDPTKAPHPLGDYLKLLQAVFDLQCYDLSAVPVHFDLNLWIDTN